jgi:hypothetical protein
VTLERGQWSYSPADTLNGKKRKLPECAQLCLDALRKTIDELGQTPPPSSGTAGVRSAVKLDQGRDMFRRIAPYGDEKSDTRQKTFKRGTERLAKNPEVERRAWESRRAQRKHSCATCEVEDLTEEAERRRLIKLDVDARLRKTDLSNRSMPA